MKKLFSLAIIFLCFTFLFGNSFPSSNIALADEEAPSITLTIDGTDYEETSLGIFAVDWKNLNGFQLALSGLDTAELEEYSWAVYYKKNMYSTGPAFEIGATKFTLFDEAEKTEFEYDINEYGRGEGSSSEYPLGFGSYMFQFMYKAVESKNLISITSAVINVIPSQIMERPEIFCEIIPNTQGLLNGFIFRISNSDYEFCDARNIKWFATATINNQIWTLEESYTAIERTGREFIFMPEMQNEFTVWAEVLADDGTTKFQSEALIVSTVNGENNQLTFWIIFASTVVGIFIMLIISVIIAKRKEKVW